jgi:hypothetical protein
VGDQADVDAGERAGVTSEDNAKIRRLEQEVRELRGANEILKSAGGFLRGGARPPTSVIVDYMDTHRDRFGVEPICRVLSEHGCQVAPSTYCAAKVRPPSSRAMRNG